MSKEIDELVRDLSSFGFIKSSIRKRVEQFVSEYKAKIIQIGEGMMKKIPYEMKSISDIDKHPKEAEVYDSDCGYNLALSEYKKKIKEA